MIPGHKEVSKSVLGLISHFSILHSFLTFLNCFSHWASSAILCISQEYNTLFKDPREFDAGNTDGSEINVYSYDGKDELHNGKNGFSDQKVVFKAH